MAFHDRSLSILPTVAAYNNKAQAEINLKHWYDAMSDCQRVLELEPGNVKGAFSFLMNFNWNSLLQSLQTDL